MPIQTPIIDWNDQAVEELPVSHRTPQFIAWMQGIVVGSNGWINKNFYNYCYGDSVSNLYSTTTNYNLNDVVIGSINAVSYSPFSITDPSGVYISLQNANIGNSPSASPNFWYQISPSYIGAQERTQYNAQKLIFEYALNRWFRTNFVQPIAFQDGTSSSPYGVWYTPVSDIYITTKSITYFSAAIEDIPSTALLSDIQNVGFSVGDTSTTSEDTTYEFIVWIPTALSILLGLSYVQTVSKVVSLMSLVGTTFQIEIY